MKINLKNIKKWFTKKRAIWVGVMLAVLITGYFFFFNKKTPQETLTVSHGDFLQQVSASGKIVTAENVDLSFEQSGIIRGVHVKVGDKVSKGKLIANQDTTKLYAQALQMQAGIDLQKAKLNQLLAGSTPQDIKIKGDAVVSASQDLENTYSSALSDVIQAQSSMYDAYTALTYINDIYFTVQYDQGIRIRLARDQISDIVSAAKKYADIAKDDDENITFAIEKMAGQLNTIHDKLNLVRELMDDSIFNTSGLNDDKESIDTQKSNINGALTDILSSKQNIISSKAALQQAKNQLQSIQAAPRTTDTAVYEAQIRQANGSLQEIYAQIREKQIIAPISGTIATINAKSGGTMASSEIAASIISDGVFQVESYVPEINISLIKVGQETSVTLDSYLDTVFSASIISIDPAETIKDGVSTYKVTIGFNDSNDPRIKSGMTGTVTITTEKKSNVISVPQGAVMLKNGQKLIKIKTGPDAKDIAEKIIETGSISSGGNVEVTFGLQDGDVVVLN